MSLEGAGCAEQQGRKWDLLLVDDPGNSAEIEAAIDGAFGMTRVVVIAFDPMQLRNHRKDEPFTDGLRPPAPARRPHDPAAPVLPTAERATTAAQANSRRSRGVVSLLPSGQDPGVQEGSGTVDPVVRRHQVVQEGGREIVYENVTKKFAQGVISDLGALDLWTHAPGLAIAIEWGSRAMRWPWERWLEGTRYCIGSQGGRRHQRPRIPARRGLLGEGLYRHVSLLFEGVDESPTSRQALEDPLHPGARVNDRSRCPRG